MIELFGIWKTDCTVYGNDGWFEDLFEVSLEDLNPRASTGLGPLSYYGSEIGQALGYDVITGQYDPERVALLRELTRERLGAPGEADPILVFVKDEPNKIAKVREGRCRIISAVGLIDTMADRIMFRWLQRAALTTVGRTPVMVGWSPYQGGYRYLSKLYGGLEVLCADKSNWDWTVRGWLLLVVRDIIHGLAVEAPPEWHSWVDARWTVLFRDAVFGFRTGERVQQAGWGVMKSGCYLTIWINSLCQCILHHIACTRLGLEPHWQEYICMGDDTAQRSYGDDNEAYLEELRKLGATIKETKLIKGGVEFCGHEVVDGKCLPAYKLKHLFKLAHCPVDILGQVLGAYQMAYAFDRVMWERLTRWLVRVAPQYSRPWEECLKLVKG